MESQESVNLAYYENKLSQIIEPMIEAMIEGND